MSAAADRTPAVTDIVDTAAIREAVGLRRGVPGAVLILDLCDEVDRLRDALDRVRCDAGEVLEHDTDDDPWFQGARAVARDVLDAIAGPQPEDDQ